MPKILIPGLLALLLPVLACGGEAPASAPPAAATAPGEQPRVLPSGAPPELPPPEVIEAAERAVAAAPEDPEAERRLARLLFDALRREESLRHFERAAELDPGVRSWLDLGLAYGKVSRLGDAERAYGKLLELAPNDPIALHNLGNVEMKRGDIERAIERYRQAIAARPGYLQAHYHLADALNQAGRYKEAYREYERVLDLEPADAQQLATFDDALYRMASLDLTMGAPERAARLLIELIRVNPEHPSAHYALGQALVQLGRPDDAQEAFDNHLRVLAGQPPTGPAASGE